MVSEGSSGHLGFIPRLSRWGNPELSGGVLGEPQQSMVLGMAMNRGSVYPISGAP